ncbi:MAG: DHA2 family efflux MFS transporter permease subunit [Pseudomonadota bacterium]
MADVVLKPPIGVDPAAHPVCPPDRRIYVLIVAIFASALGFIDGSVVAVAIPQIRADLGATFAQVQWVSNAYMLFLAALMLLGGGLADRFGLRRVFVWGIVAFVGASLLCAMAQSAEQLIAFRALKGIGAAVVIPGSMALIAVHFPAEERGRALGIWVAASAITTSLGPLLGGFALTYLGGDAWRWIFAINLPLGLICLALLALRVPADRPRPKTRLDFFGAALVTIAMGALALGLTLFGEEGGTGLVWTLIVVGLVVGALSVLFEARVAHPMLKVALFARPLFRSANLLTVLVWSGLSLPFFFLPMLLVVAWQLPETYAGAMFLPFTVAIAVLSPIVGRLSDQFGVRGFLMLGAVLASAAHVAIALAVAYQDYWWGLLPALTLMGIAFGFSASPVSTAIMASVQDDETGSASAINNMVSRLASLFAVVAFGGIAAWGYEHMVMAGDLPTDIARALVDAGFGERLTGGLFNPATQELQRVAMNHVMIVMCLLAALLSLSGAVVGFFMKSKAQ